MGDVADMMLDGTLCEGCGSYMDGEADGIPRRCGSCRRDDRARAAVVKAVGTAKAIQTQDRAQQMTTCPTCGRPVKTVGLNQHMQAKHA